MRHGILALSGMWWLLSSVTLAQSLPPGDVAAGRRLAIDACSNCHVVVERPMRPAMAGAPAFATLANDPAVTEISLRAFLQTPHARMTNLALTRSETDDLIGYIFSLRRGSRTP